MVFLIGQGNGRSDDNRIAGMNAHWIKILHRADGDGVPLPVAYNLKLNLFPPRDALLHQNLMDGRLPDTTCSNLAQLVFVVGDATPTAP